MAASGDSGLLAPKLTGARDPATARAVSGSGGATEAAPAIGLATIGSGAVACRTGRAPTAACVWATPAIDSVGGAEARRATGTAELDEFALDTLTGRAELVGPPLSWRVPMDGTLPALALGIVGGVAEPRRDVGWLRAVPRVRGSDPGESDVAEVTRPCPKLPGSAHPTNWPE